MTNLITIAEDLAATQFICRAHRLSDGFLVGEVTTDQTSVALPVSTNQSVYVIVIPVAVSGETARPLVHSPLTLDEAKFDDAASHFDKNKLRWK
jgi:hypothetical protein